MSPASEEPRSRDTSFTSLENIGRRGESARCRGTGAGSGTADFDSSGKLSALCVRRGFPTPLYRARRAPDVPPGGGGGQGAGEGEGDSVSAPVPPPLTHAGNKSVSALSALTSQEPLIGSHDDSRAIHPPSPLNPCRPSLSSHPDAPSRAHAPPGASWQQVSDPALRSAACPESRTDTEIETGAIDIDRRAAGRGDESVRKGDGERTRQEESRIAARRVCGRILDYRGLVTWISRK